MQNHYTSHLHEQLPLLGHKVEQDACVVPAQHRRVAQHHIDSRLQQQQQQGRKT
jgi:hypothetical protein